MTQPLTINRIQVRRGFFAAIAGLLGITTNPRPRVAPAPAPFDPELHIIPPFALLNAGPR